MTEENQKTQFSINLKSDKDNNIDIKNLASYEAIQTDKIVNPVSKVYKEMTNRKTLPHLFDSGAIFTVSNYKRKDKEVALRFDSTNDLDADLTPYEKIIMKVVGNLYNDGNEFISIDQIYRKSNGYHGRQPASKSAQRDILEALEKLRNTFVYADFSQHYVMSGQIPENLLDKDNEIIDINDSYFSENRTIISEERLVDWKKEAKLLNNKVAVGITVKELPIMLKYSIDIKQVDTVPDEYLNLSDLEITDNTGKTTKVTASKDRTTIVHELADRIKEIRNQTKKDKLNEVQTIKMEHFYEVIAHNKKVATLTKRQQESVRESVSLCLKNFEQKGLITDPEINLKRKKRENIFYLNFKFTK